MFKLYGIAAHMSFFLCWSDHCNGHPSLQNIQQKYRLRGNHGQCLWIGLLHHISFRTGSCFHPIIRVCPVFIDMVHPDRQSTLGLWLKASRIFQR